MDGILYYVVDGTNTNFHDATDGWVLAYVHVVQRNMHRLCCNDGCPISTSCVEKLSLVINS